MKWDLRQRMWCLSCLGLLGAKKVPPAGLRFGSCLRGPLLHQNCSKTNNSPVKMVWEEGVAETSSLFWGLLYAILFRVNDSSAS